MKTQYESSYQMWLQFQDGSLEAVESATKGIWQVTETATGDFGFVFSDEVEQFYPTIYETVEKASEGRREYCVRELTELGQDLENKLSQLSCADKV